jgi:hypothetical protein
MKLERPLSNYKALANIGRQGGFIGRFFGSKGKTDRGDYDGGSLVFDDGSSQYLSRTTESSVDDTDKVTVSFWAKRSELTRLQSVISGAVNSTNYGSINFGAGDNVQVIARSTGSGVYCNVSFAPLRRDTHAWDHYVIHYDAANGTAANRVRLWINNVEADKVGSPTYPTAGQSIYFNSASQTSNIGRRAGANDWLYNGYLSDVILIDGVLESPSSFGRTSTDTGKWVPIPYQGSYGTNGFHLTFDSDDSDTTTVTDQSGNSNDWTANGYSSDVTTNGYTNDTPVDNYATFNPLQNSTSNLPATLSTGNNNLLLAGGTNGYTTIATTIPLSSGKYYWEVFFSTDVNAGTWASIGIKNVLEDFNGSGAGGATAGEYYFLDSGNLGNNGSFPSFGNAQANTFSLGVALDLDNNKIWFRDSTGWFNSGDPEAGTNEAFSITAGTYLPVINYYRSTATNQIATFKGANGVFAFAYTPPAGFKEVTTSNLPEPTIKKPQLHADILLYTGDGVAIGSGGNSVTGADFTPDFVWYKNRDQADNHLLYDVIRGVTNYLVPNATSAETTGLTEGLASFDDGGFTVGNNVASNTNTEDYWSLLIKAAGAGVANSDGSISSTVSANQAAGFSIVTYTGTGANATVGHGLGQAPDLIIVKERSTVNNWVVYHSANTSAPETDFLKLEATDATADNNLIWNDTSPTSTVFSIGTSSGTNSNTDDFVAYCFVFGDVFAGGSFTGDGSNKPFIPTDELLLYLEKRTGFTGNWHLLDQARNTYNPANGRLFPNTNNAEDTGTDTVDFFKQRH